MKRPCYEPDISRNKKPRGDTERKRTNFAVTPIDGFRGVLPFYRQPMEVGHFSLDDMRNFHDDNRQLRRFSPPKKIDFDLRAGYNEFVKRNEDETEGLVNLLRWINCHRDKFEIIGSPAENRIDSCRKTPLSSLHTDFITWRGHLTKIMCTPYERRDSWKMAVTLYNGTIFISEVETEENREKRKSMTEKQKEMCFWGYSFESCVTSKCDKDCIRYSNSENKSKSDPVNDSEAFITVIRTRLGKHSIVFGAEVDCCTKEDEKKPPANYIELKTSIRPYTLHQQWNFKRYKLIKWWAQSYLAGVPKIICGFRDHNGHVQEIQTYNTLAIPRLVRDTEDIWDSSVCLNFLDRFLVWLKSVVVKSGPDIVYMLSWREPFVEVTVTETELCDGSSPVLPEWFLENFQKF